MNESDLELPENFGNEVSLFPLPEVVLFPGVIQAFHIFEPRYKQMTRDSLATDRLIALTMLKSDTGAEKPDICQMICIGKIIADVRLSDGRYNLVVGGVCRALIEEEIGTKLLYRRAKISIPQETNLHSPRLDDLRIRIVEIYRQLAETGGYQIGEILESIGRPDLSFSQCLDFATHFSEAPAEQKQRILELLDLEQRAEAVLKILHSLRDSLQVQPDSQTFPPGFSLN